MRLHPAPRPKSKPRILQLITDLEMGGAPMMVRHLARNLHRRQYPIAVACLGKDGPIADSLRQEGITTDHLNANGIKDLSVFARLAMLISKFKPDILHTHLMHANISGRMIGRFCQVPCIISTIHTVEKRKKWHLTLESLTQRLTDKIICVSPSVHNFMQSYIHTARLGTICNAIPVDKYLTAKPFTNRELNLNPDWPTLIFTGRLDAVKNIPRILEAIKLLCQTNRPVQILIVGDGPQKSALLSITRHLQLENHVHFLGMRRDIARLLHSADIFVMASFWEGMSMSALEAMAAGIPIAASNVPGIRDMIQHQKTGLLAQPDNPRQLADNIITLLDNPSLAHTMTQNALNLVKTKFSIDIMVDNYCRLYLHLRNAPHH